MPTASVYAASKAAVTSLTECLAMQFDLRGHQPAGRHLLPVGRAACAPGCGPRTATDPPNSRANVRVPTEAMTIEKLEEMAKAGGHELKFQDLDELAQVVVDGIRADRFIMMIGVESIGATMRDRAAAFETGSLPGGHAGLLG